MTLLRLTTTGNYDTVTQGEINDFEEIVNFELYDDPKGMNFIYRWAIGTKEALKRVLEMEAME